MTECLLDSLKAKFYFAGVQFLALLSHMKLLRYAFVQLCAVSGNRSCQHWTSKLSVCAGFPKFTSRAQPLVAKLIVSTMGGNKSWYELVASDTAVDHVIPC